MEADLSHHAQACGCEPAAATVAIVLAVLAIGRFVFGAGLALPHGLTYVAWGVLSAIAGALVKVAFLADARRRLRRIYRDASALTEGGPR